MQNKQQKIQKLVEILPKMYPKLTKNRPKMGLGGGLEGQLGPTWAQEGKKWGGT